METINNTHTVQALKAIGAAIYTRKSNHHVEFEIDGIIYEIAAKNNREYQLNVLDFYTHEFKREVIFNQNPITLLNYFKKDKV
jgi:hypothetical protein